ncbi:MAG: hypothetical protein V4557_12565 [Bacteroidota bacterium]
MATNNPLKYKSGKTEIEGPNSAECRKLIRYEQRLRTAKWIAGILGLGSILKYLVDWMLRSLSG